MTVLFHDVEEEVGEKCMSRTMDLVDFSNVLYADDTLAVMEGKENTSILRIIVKDTDCYGVKQNNDKREASW